MAQQSPSVITNLVFTTALLLTSRTGLRLAEGQLLSQFVLSNPDDGGVPAVIGVSQHTACVVSDTGKVFGFDLVQNKTLWSSNNTNDDDLTQQGTTAASFAIVGSNEASAYALDIDDGHLRWKTYLGTANFRHAFISPDESIVVVAAGGSIFGLNATDGAQLWVQSGDADFGFLGSAVHPDVVYEFESGYRNYHGPLVTVAALNVTSGEQQWSYTCCDDDPRWPDFYQFWWSSQRRPIFSPDETLLYVAFEHDSVITVFAMNVLDMTERWRYSVYADSTMNGLALSVDGTVLYLFASKPRIYAFNTSSSDLLWMEDDFPSSTSFDLGLPHPPKLDAKGQRVFVGESDPRAVRGYSVYDGTLQISIEAPYFADYDMVTVDDVDVILLENSGRVTAMSMGCADGDSDGICNDFDSCPTTPLNDADDDRLCFAVDSCPLDYENDKDSDGICSSTDSCPWDPFNDSDSDNVCGDDADAIAWLWEFVPPNYAGVQTVLPTATNAMVYAGGSSGHVLAANATSRTTVLWQDLTAGSVSAPLAKSSTALFAGSGDYNFYAYDIADGNLLWRTYIGTSDVRQAFVVPDESVLVVAAGGNVYGLNTTDGAQLWVQSGDADFGLLGSAVHPDVVYEFESGYRNYHGPLVTVAALNVTSGEQQWSYTCCDDDPRWPDFYQFWWSSQRRPIFSPDETLLYVAFEHDSVITVFAMNVPDMTERWRYSVYADSTMNGLALSVDGTVLYLFASKPRIYAFNTSSSDLLWMEDDFPSSTSFDLGLPHPPKLDAKGQRVFVGESDPRAVRGYSVYDGTLQISIEEPYFADYDMVTVDDVDVILLENSGRVTAMSMGCADGDSDGICNDFDSCPTTPLNDADDDRLCFAVDSCPSDYENDKDSDGICSSTDSCPWDPFNDSDSDNVCDDDANDTSSCLWEFVPPRNTDVLSVLPVVASALVFVGTSNGHVLAANATSRTTVLWQDLTAGSVSAPLAKSSTALFAGSGDYNFYAYDIADGNLLWRTYIGTSDVRQAFVVPDESVLVVAAGGNVYGLNTTDGAQLWVQSGDADFGLLGSAVHPDVVYEFESGYRNYHGPLVTVAALNVTSGEQQWSYTCCNDDPRWPDFYQFWWSSQRRPIFSPDETAMYVGFEHDSVITVIALHVPDMVESWRDSVYVADSTMNGLALSADGSVLFVFCSDGRVNAHATHNGTILWIWDNFPTSTSFDFMSSNAPLLDPTKGLLYLGESSPNAVLGYSVDDAKAQISFTDIDFVDFVFDSTFNTIVLETDDGHLCALTTVCDNHGGDTDSDGICNALDSCVDDALNDLDGDGTCFAADSCPADTFNDADSDGVCGRQCNRNGSLLFSNVDGEDLAIVGMAQQTIYLGSGTSPGTVRAVPLNSTCFAWTTQTSNAVVARGQVFDDGDDTWLFVMSEDRNLYCLRKQDGHIVWRFYVNDMSFPPAVAQISIGGALAVVVVVVDGSVVGLDAQTGRELWRQSGVSSCCGAVLVGGETTDAQEVMVVSSSEKTVLAFDVNTGAKLWISETAPSQISSLPSHLQSQSLLFYALNHYPGYDQFTVWAVDTRTNGTVAWQSALDNSVFRGLAPVENGGSSLLAFGDDLYKQAKMYSLNAQDGSLEWITTGYSSETHFAFRFSPTLSHDGASIYMSEGSLGVRRYSVATGLLTGIVDAAPIVHDFVLVPDKNAVVLTSSDRAYLVPYPDTLDTDTDIEVGTHIVRDLEWPEQLPQLAAECTNSTNPYDPRQYQVLFLEDSYNDAYQEPIEDLGLEIVTVTSAQWSTMTTTDFHQYRAIVFGSVGSSSESTVATATTTAGVWSSAIDGNVVIIGSDEVARAHETDLIARAMAYVVAAECKTGLYVSLSRYFKTDHYPQTIGFLSGLGTFQAYGDDMCYESAHIVATHPVVDGLTDAHLSGWGCSVHQAITSWPSGFTPIAVTTDFSSTAYDVEFSDGSAGVPFILVSGEAVVVNCNHEEAILTRCDDASDCRYVYPEITLSRASASMIGGARIIVTGPCFDVEAAADTPWTCIFGSASVPLEPLTSSSGVCRVPPANSPGTVLFAILRSDEGLYNGLQTTTFTYTNIFLDSNADAVANFTEHRANRSFYIPEFRHNVTYLDAENVTVEWDNETMVSDLVNIVFLEVDYTDGEYSAVPVAILANQTANDGWEQVHVPDFNATLDPNGTAAIVTIMVVAAEGNTTDTETDTEADFDSFDSPQHQRRQLAKRKTKKKSAKWKKMYKRLRKVISAAESVGAKIKLDDYFDGLESVTGGLANLGVQMMQMLIRLFAAPVCAAMKLGQDRLGPGSDQFTKKLPPCPDEDPDNAPCPTQWGNGGPGSQGSGIAGFGELDDDEDYGLFDDLLTPARNQKCKRRGSQVCCYNNKDGKLNKNGRPESVDPTDNRIYHMKKDSLSFEICCEWTYNAVLCAEEFDEVKPPNGGKDPVPVDEECPRVGGDAHFVTVDGLAYSFNGIGHYLLATANTNNTTAGVPKWSVAVELQTFGMGSVVSAIAVNDSSTNTMFEISSGDGISGIVIYVDGTPLLVPNGVFKLATFTIDYRSERVELRWPGVGLIGSFWYENLEDGTHYLQYALTIDDIYAGALEGMLGNFDGNAENDLVVGAKTLPHDASLETIHFEFGMEWLLSTAKATKFFRNSFNDSEIAAWVPAFENSFAGCDEGFGVLATSMCAGNKFCLYDAAATCRLDVANQTLIFEAVHSYVNSFVNTTTRTTTTTTATTATATATTATATTATTTSTTSATTTTFAFSDDGIESALLQWWAYLGIAIGCAVCVAIAVVVTVVVVKKKKKKKKADQQDQAGQPKTHTAQPMSPSQEDV